MVCVIDMLGHILDEIGKNRGIVIVYVIEEFELFE